MKIFYFTATGNSLYVAKKVGGELISIPQALKNNTLTFEDEKIGIIFPCYGLSTPKIVREFIEKVTLKSPYIFTILTYGNTIANACAHFSKYAKKHNINIVYANSLLMVDNYLPIFDIEKQKLREKNIDYNLNKLISDINNNTKKIHSGTSLDALLTNSGSKLLPLFTSPKKFLVTDDCIFCKTCVKVCPRQNISIDKEKGIKPNYGSNCEFCLSCINLCPKKAIKLKKEKNPEARFKNEHITVKEIIDSNIQY